MNLRIILTLGALSAFAPLVIDFYLPGFPAMAIAFGTDEKHIQTTLAVHFTGLAIGQLIYGPLADRFGRRVPLLSGVTLFTLASFACAYAPSLEWLIAARFVQALGGCAGMVISRAVVSDKCYAVGSAKGFSQLMLVTGLAPILAPLPGGAMVGLWGWQSIFLALTVFSVRRRIGGGRRPAGNLPGPSAAAAIVRRVAAATCRCWSDRVYLGYAVTGGIAIGGMFAYIAGSPFVFIKLYGVPAEHYGWLFGINAAGFILVAQVNARLLSKRGPALLADPSGVGCTSRRRWHCWRQRLAYRSTVAAAGAAVSVYRQPGLHHAQYLGVRHERPGRAGRQRLGTAGLYPVWCGGGCGVVGRRIARWHGHADGRWSSACAGCWR